jgi:hypothetical protein
MGMLLVAGTLRAQSVKDAEKAFRDAVVKQRFLLRGMSADAVVTFDWTGNGARAETPKVRTFGVVIPESVSTKGDRIEIQGQRSTLSTNERGRYELTGMTPVKVEVMLGGADPGSVYPQLKGGLFFTDLNEALGAVPAIYRKLIPNDASKRQTGKDDFQTTTPCTAGPVTPPKVLHTVDPEFSEEARRKKFNGSVVLAVTVEPTGQTGDIWLARAAGMGLDEQGAKAVRGYVFQPATCGGTPVAVALQIGVNFQIF